MSPSLENVALDQEKYDEISKIIEELTTSGRQDLDKAPLKKLKSMCRQSDDCVSKVYSLSMTQLEEDHAEIRFSSLLLINELFIRSHCFREHLLADFRTFMDLTLETDTDLPLPQPKAAAKKLKMKATELIHVWNEEFGIGYKRLSLGYQFLKDCKKVDFVNIRAQNLAERQREEEKIAKLEAQRAEQLSRATEEMRETLVDIDNCLRQIESCWELLMPAMMDFLSNDTPSNRGPADRTSDNKINEQSNANETVKVQLESSETQAESPETLAQSSEMLAQSSEMLAQSSETADSSETKLQIVTNDTESNVNSETNVTVSDSTSCKDNTEINANQSTVIVNGGSNENVFAISKGTEFTSSSGAKNESDDDDNNNDDDDDDLEGFSSSEDEDDNIQDELIREHGFGNKKFSIDIDVNPRVYELTETEDNTDVLSVLKDSVNLINNKFMPSVQKWLEVFARCGGCEKVVKEALDIKEKLTSTRSKIYKVKVNTMKRKDSTTVGKDDNNDDDGDDDDDDFEEVKEKEGYEASVPAHLLVDESWNAPKLSRPSTSRGWTIPKARINSKPSEDDPTTWQATVRKMKARIEAEKQSKMNPEALEQSPKRSPATSDQKSPTLSKRQSVSYMRGSLLDRAPVVPYGMDLYHWGDDKVETPLVVRYEDDSHRFWRASDDSDVKIDKAAVESMQSRVIHFTGDSQPVKWKCRAPLPSGQLCERMDRVKCPFHGRIIPRDIMGQPCREEDKQRLAKEAEKRQQEKGPEWEDQDFQQDLQAATGVDLSRKGKGQGKKKGKSRKKKYPGLTDVKKIKNTTRNRLETKVLSRGAVKRVASAMDGLDHKRYKDKFANQFNYQFS